jgi:hypothetical protein
VLPDLQRPWRARCRGSAPSKHCEQVRARPSSGRDPSGFRSVWMAVPAHETCRGITRGRRINFAVVLGPSPNEIPTNPKGNFGEAKSGCRSRCRPHRSSVRGRPGQVLAAIAPRLSSIVSFPCSSPRVIAPRLLSRPLPRCRGAAPSTSSRSINPRRDSPGASTGLRTGRREDGGKATRLWQPWGRR